MKNDEYYMSIALEEAKSAYESEEVPVGALLVRGESIVATSPNTKKDSLDPTAHAEITVIRDAARIIGNWRLNGCTLYVTKEPCIMCAGAIINARIERLVYGCGDKRYGAIDSRFHIIYDPGLNHRISVRSGVLKDECSDILKRFFKKKRQIVNSKG